jgi:mRNA interferase RelE/StbE
MFEIFLLPSAQKELDRLEARAFARILKRIRELSSNARPPGCLKLTDEQGYRVRAGDSRILYRIEDAAKRVHIYRIKHRKDVYS